jgi:subtilisin-like proprotein convertase family protein
VLNPDTLTATSVATGLASAPGNPARVTGAAAAFPNIEAHRLADSLSPHHRVTIEPGAACGVAIPLDVGISDSTGTIPATLDLPVGRPQLSLAATDVPAAGEGSTWTVSSTIPVALSFVPTTVLATVQIDAGDIGELVVDLTSPQTTVTLHNQSGSGGTTIQGTYGNDLTPDGPGSMTDFEGQQAQGNWTLTVSDVVNPGGPSPGTLQSWSLFFLGPGLPAGCDPLSCGADPVPPEVTLPLTVTREQVTDLRFDWPAVAGASGYRIWRSPTADFAQEALLGTSATNTFLEAGTGNTPVTFFYRVRAVNSCEWEGP